MIGKLADLRSRLSRPSTSAAINEQSCAHDKESKPFCGIKIVSRCASRCSAAWGLTRRTESHSWPFWKMSSRSLAGRECLERGAFLDALGCFVHRLTNRAAPVAFLSVSMPDGLFFHVLGS